MFKIQKFYKQNQKLVILTMTILIILAELSLHIFNSNYLYQLIMFITAIIGIIPIFINAFSALKFKMISIELLITLATFGAFIIHEFNEAAFVTFLFLLGNLLESFTLKKTRSEIKKLTEMAPKKAIIIDKDQKQTEVAINKLKINDQIIVKPGSQIPVDGSIISGSGLINEANITGEAKLVKKYNSDEVYSGTNLEDGSLIIQVNKTGRDTTFGKIINLVEESQDKKSNSQKFIDRFAKYYTPIVLILSLLVGLISMNLKIAITMMVLGCPGALIIGVPVSNVAGIGAGAKKHILFKGGQAIANLNQIDTVLFDKTGTLTTGNPEVEDFILLQGSKKNIQQILQAAESESNHPLAKAILKFTNSKSKIKLNQSTTIKGKGLKVNVSGTNYFIGNQTLINENINQKNNLASTIRPLEQQHKTIVIISNYDQSELAILAIRDHLRPEENQALTKLKEQGIKNLTILSGDSKTSVNALVNELPIDQGFGNLLPEDKAQYIKELQANNHKVMFVGDGINDSPAISNADIGIAMGSGTDVSIDISDIVLINSNLNDLSTAKDIANKTYQNMNQNIFISIFTVVILLIGVFFNVIQMGNGMFFHEISILIVILNAIRLSHFFNKN
ncbi:heavy metal translocating P-type ATPase [Lactobacillus sp. S2-2]|uniref:heavy metal translocating P-type ATPase n=1 Tax=Lactobacillus sp. S2-2 TaxID=2692917 RepID=UPI001F2E5ED5|nr:cation-translocating P-type ATPase [Lactobacillus sp. S2-2]MCF6515589.1 heavy metal translocating P-type ATPase [Lactobacillus sp. S2-2]